VLVLVLGHEKQSGVVLVLGLEKQSVLVLGLCHENHSGHGHGARVRETVARLCGWSEGMTSHLKCVAVGCGA
jgi:hypothetical protein